ATSDYVINMSDYNEYNEDYVQLINGAYYVKKTIDTNFTADITYVGTALDVVVPSTINGYPVKAVTGTTNEAIKSLALSAGIKEIGGFYELYNLAAVTLNNDLERINSDCFTNNRALTSIAIPGSVKTIGGSAFSGCTALAAASIGNGVKEIGSYAFYNTALSGVMIPASVVSIGSFAFGYVSNLNTFTVDPTDTIATLKDGFAIGGASTEAYNYAVKNGINYVDATNGCTHAYNTATVPATLFAKGSKTSVCPICGATETKSINKKTFKISSLKSSKKGTIVVKAAKQEGIAGYKVEYSTSKKFTKKTTKTVTVKSTKALSKTIKGLKSGKKYYVRVRAYNKANGKTVYSKYTAVKSVKVK
ncbi:MAG: leucine-rich repeat protein, partial [Eubacterium sp.]